MSQDQNKEQNMRRVALTSLAGTSIEWYDFFSTEPQLRSFFRRRFSLRIYRRWCCLLFPLVRLLLDSLRVRSED